jgi:hypothetical protein
VGTWSLYRGRFVDPNIGLDDLSPAALARDIIKGLWVVTGRTRLNGRPAIELTETRAGVYQPLPTVLWVDARTHLPLRMINGPAKLSTQVDWSCLKPTAANMTQLLVPIPRATRASTAPCTDRSTSPPSVPGRGGPDRPSRAATAQVVPVPGVSGSELNSWA